MLKNYLITTLRNIRKNKAYTAINILGLGVGLGCCLVVFSIIRYENSFDQNHPDVYRVVNRYDGDHGTFYSGVINYAVGHAIKNEIAGLKHVAQLHGPVDEKFSFENKSGNIEVFRESNVLYADSNYLAMMEFPIISGADASILSEPYKMFITQRMVTKYFGDRNPIGQTLTMENKKNVEIVGILADIPDNTNLSFDFLLSFQTMYQIYPSVFSQWNMTWAGSTYVQLPENEDPETINERMKVFNKKYLDEEDRDKNTYYLQPLAEVHTDETFGDGMNYVSPAMMLKVFVVLAILLLGTACLNFINLSTAQATLRAKEVGIRKTLGSSRTQLTTQFLSETFSIVLLSMLLGLTVGQLLLNGYNHMVEMISFDIAFDGYTVLFAMGLSLVVTFLAGFYPAVILSGYQPVKALKNQINLSRGSGNFNLRRVLVIVQFALANLLLIAAVIISAQMNYVQNKDLGFTIQDKVLIPFPDQQKLESIKSAYLAKSYVENASITFGAPLYNNNWNMSFNIPGEPHVDGNIANMKFIDSDYLEHYNLQLVAGQNIQDRTINDTTFNILVNDKLLGNLGFTREEALGRWLQFGPHQCKIIGVVADFHNRTLDEAIGPVVMMYRPGEMSQISLQLKGDVENRYMADMEATFREFYPNELFEPEILDQSMRDRYYVLQTVMHKIINLVTIIAIMISIMGLYGLVSFMANRNAKSIGIRKVFGASVYNILSIFLKEYGALLLIAFAISAPIAYFLMKEWITNFVYHIDIGISYFLVGLIISLTIAGFTVGYRSFRAATMNPTQSLRYE